MADSYRKVIEYVADHSRVLRAIRQIEQANARMSQTLGSKFGRIVKVIGTDFDSISKKTIVDPKGITQNVQALEKMGTTVKMADGRMGTFTETIRRNADGSKVLSGTFKTVNKNAIGLGQNMANLAKRAALTIPVWLALRSAFMGTIRTIRDGIRAIAEMDKRLQKARRNLQGTPREVETNFKKLREEATRLSLETGIAVEDIIVAFQRFATTGQDFETSMGGAIASVKLAQVEFGDTVKVANALARSYKVLGHTVEGNISSQEKLTKVAALIDELWKTNAFDINELGDALERFSAVANTMNISMEDSIKLLATLHSGAVVNTRAGRLLSNSVARLVVRLDEVQKALGLELNPTMETTSSILLKVVDRFFELRKAGDFATLQQATTILKDIFQLRGKLPIESFIALREVLRENIETVGDVDKLNKAFKDVNKTTGVLVDRFHNANKEIGKAFVTGVGGGEDFNRSLQNIVKTLTNMIDGAEDFGEIMRTVIFAAQLRLPSAFKSATESVTKDVDRINERITEFGNRLRDALRGELSVGELKEFISTFRIEIKKLEELSEDVFHVSPDEYVKAIESLTAQLKRQIEESTKLAKQQKKAEGVQLFNAKQREEFLKEEEQLKAQLEARGLTELETEQKLLQIRKESGLFIQKELDLQEELLVHLKTMEAIELERTRKKGLIQNQLELLKLQGATNLQLLQAEHTLNNMYGINQGRISLLQNELAIQREITKEKLGQEKLSSDTLKLFQIAQKEGNRAATAVAQFLRGEITSLDQLAVRTGVNVKKILEEFFPARLEEFRARAFFGLPGAMAGILTGMGRRIPIPERGIPLAGLKLPEITTSIGNLKVEIKKIFEQEELSQAMINNLAEAIRNNDQLKQAIDERIENY